MGQAQYSCFLHETGGIVDDCLVYRAADKMMLVVNASNTPRTGRSQPLREEVRLQAREHLRSDGAAGGPGPEAQAVLQPLAPGVKLDGIKYYHFTTGKVAGADCVISRTGYTGEDGFELYHANRDAGSSGTR